MALLDTGSSVSMVRAHLVPEGRPTLRLTAIAGVNRQVQKWPVDKLTLRYANQSHAFDILKVEDLPFPVFLDAPNFGVFPDAPNFGALVQATLQEVSVAEADDHFEAEDSPEDLSEIQSTWAINP